MTILDYQLNPQALTLSKCFFHLISLMKFSTKHRIFLLTIKYGPAIIALTCFIAGIMQFLLTHWTGVYICAILVLLFLGFGMLFASYTFDFCIYHKLTILYIVSWAIIQCSFWYWNCIELAVLYWLINYIFIFLVIIIVIYLKFYKK